MNTLIPKWSLINSVKHMSLKYNIDLSKLTIGFSGIITHVQDEILFEPFTGKPIDTYITFQS